MAEEFTAKFKVDISDLKQNIAEANRQIKLANATFKAETAGMDKWAKDADGLSSKLKQLKTVLEGQKTILQSYKDQLKAQQEAYDENGKRADQLRAKLKELAENGVSKTSAEYKEYQTALKHVTREQDGNGKAVDTLNLKVLEQEAAVKDTEKQIRHYDESMENLGQETEEVTEQVAEASDGFTVWKGVLADLAASAIKAVVSSLKDMAAAAGEAWKEFDEGADNITKRTGATGEAAAALQEVYKNVAGNVVADLGTIGDAVGEVNTRFGSTGEELEDLSTKFLKFAELNGTDVSSSIDSVQAAMAAFGVETESTGDVLDILNKAAQDTGVPLDKLTQSLLSNGPALQEMGFGINTATGFLASLEKSGIDTGTMLAGLKKALQNATKDGKPLNEALAEMQEKMAGAATETEAAQIATELFGAKAGPAIAKAVQEGRVSFDELSNTVQDWGDSVNATFDATLDAPDQFALAMQNVKVAVGSTVGEFLDEHAPQITAILQDLTDNVLPGATAALGALLDGFSWLIDNGEGIAAAVVGIAAGVGAYVAYQTALTVMSEGWTALTVVTKAQTIAQTALNAVMAANPIGIVIAAIAALVAAFVVLWNTNEDFRKKVIELWTALKENISKLIEGIKETVTKIWNDIKETVSGTVTAIKDTVTKIWNNIKETVSGTVSAIKDTVTSTWEAVKTKVTDTVNGIKEKVSEAWNNVKESVSGAVENVKTKVADAWDNVKSKTTEIWESVKSKTSEAWKNVKSSITKPIEDAKEAVRKAVDSIRDKINNVKLEFPKIKLPHFTVTGGEAPWGLMGKGSMPKISVSWYARGGVFDSPTLLSGIGEDGAEAVVPLEKNKEWIRKVAADMSAELRAELGAGGFTSTGAGRSSRTTFTQIINAPKQPSRLELYRQTRNLLALREATT